MNRIAFTLLILTLTACTSLHGQILQPSPADTAAKISDHPLVRLITSAVKPEDAKTSLDINGLWGDKIQAQCTTWVIDPQTRTRANALLDLKSAFQIVPIVPIAPTGWISLLAEARRVEHDVNSGALTVRIAAKRKEFVDLHTDFMLACGPLMMDLASAPIRLPAELVAAAKAAIP